MHEYAFGQRPLFGIFGQAAEGPEHAGVSDLGTLDVADLRNLRAGGRGEEARWRASTGVDCQF
jgi:hypothetical protein